MKQERRMRRDKKVIPVVDCPVCGAIDVPLSHEATMVKAGAPDLEVWRCSSCGKVPNVGQVVKIKKYVSIKGLEQLGWGRDDKEDSRRELRASILSRRDTLDERLSELESQALSLEERADYAEKEAQLRKRIRDTQDRIRASQPLGILGGLNVSNLGGLWGRIPILWKVLPVLVVLVVVLLLLGKTCS